MSGEGFWAYSVKIFYCFQAQPVFYVGIFHGFFLYWLEVYSIDSFETIGNFFEVLNIGQFFLKLNRFICD